MMDVDEMLGRLRAEPPHPRLAALDGAALAEIARTRAVDVRGALTAAGVAALLIGMAGGVLPPAQVETATAAVPFGTPSPLAPSTLLGG